MKWFKGIFFVSLAFSIAGVVAIGSILSSVYLRTPNPDAASVAFEIAIGEGVNQISVDLDQAGLINNKLLFETYVWLLGREGDFKAGRYQIQPGVNLSELVSLLTGVGTGVDVTVTIPEGYTAAQIGGLLEEKLGIDSFRWEGVTGIDSAFDHVVAVTRDKPDSVGLEGYLFPDTYYFSSDTTAGEIVLKMTLTLERRLAENNVNAFLGDSDPYNFHQLLTLASIIEREVRSEEDMALVSDIFRKRLEAGMALQADSTVNYVTGNDTPAISLEDRDIDSPYNTYKYAGLPPGPISNPGIAAIIAAYNPEPNDYWFFLTTPEGEVIYAETFEEHVTNKRIYLGG